MAFKDGGPAFPRPWSESPGYQYDQQMGMSLRDYFAGQALVALALGDRPRESTARLAYNLADAMLAERESR